MDFLDIICLGLLDFRASNLARVNLFKKYLEDYFEVNISGLLLRCPSYFEMYEKYIEREKESMVAYDQLKSKTLDLLGRELVEDMLNHTRFLYRTKTLTDKHMEDTVSIDSLPY